MPNLKKISIYDMDAKLLIDENNMLYWDGKPIVTEEKLVFQDLLPTEWVESASNVL